MKANTSIKTTKLTKPEHAKFNLTAKQLWAQLPIERKREIMQFIKTNGKKGKL